MAKNITPVPGESNRWIVSFYERPGVRKQSRVRGDKATAQSIQRRLQSDAEMRRRGYINDRDDFLAEQRRRAIGEHREDYKTYLGSKGNSDQHVKETDSLIREIITECKWKTIADVDGVALAKHLKDCKDTDDLSPRAINKRRTAVRSFTRWLVREHRLNHDPLVGVASVREDADRRVVRRALDDGEISALIDGAERGPERYGLSGPDRAMIYRVALGTGLRAGELASLTRRSFDLNADGGPVVAVEAGYSKRRRRDVLPMRADLAAILRPWLAGKDTAAPLWQIKRHYTAKMVGEDLAAGLAAANITPSTDPRTIDFHGLRHTYVSRLVRAGTSVKLTQTLARHSTPVLTMNTYAHVGLADQVAALAALPPFTTPTATAQALRTGTDNAPLDTIGAQHQAQQIARELGQLSARPDTVATIGPGGPVRHKSMQTPGLGTAGRSLTSEKAAVGFEPTKVSQRICNPLH
jgi:integrase